MSEKQDDVCIIVPTYNEAQNINEVLEKIFSQQEKLPTTTLHVLVVDDNSPDGTAQKVEHYQKKNKNLHLLNRKNKEGLGAAYIAGMSHVMQTIQSDIIMEMDADLSHNPNDIPRLITKIHEGNDFVIGSRYIAGGSTPEDWGVKREFISKAANTYLRKMLSIKDVKDCTGGFRAIKTTILQRIDLHNLQAKGYAFQIALLHAAIRQGARVAEVPIAFKDRKAGKSKLAIKDMIELAMVIFPLRKAARKDTHTNTHTQEHVTTGQ